MKTFQQRALYSWASAGLLGVLCVFLAVTQYRWIGDISRAEKDRLRDSLEGSLNRLGRDFNNEISMEAAALMANGAQVESAGREAAYAARYAQWRETTSHPQIFGRIAIAVPEKDSVVLKMMNTSSQEFEDAAWPTEWAPLRDRLRARISAEGPGFFGGPGGPGGPGFNETGTLIEFPRFRGFVRGRGPDRTRGRRDQPMGFGPGIEQEWLVTEVSLDYVRSSLLPSLLQRHLGVAGSEQYQVNVFARSKPEEVLYPTGSGRIADPDAQVNLFEVRYDFVRRGPARPREGEKKAAPPPPPRPLDTGRGRWTLMVRHNAGSLEALVARARMRNLLISGGVLLLMLATIALLVHSSREAQRLAELQMNFVAGVSHELRTPLTVIRTAAFNLRGRMAANPPQVERYGQLIQEESTKLEALVEQVLRFASSRTGRAIRERVPVDIEDVIEQGIRSSRIAVEGDRLIVERKIDPNLPIVLADEMALKHAIQNLLDNAVKYGTETNNWIGIAASKGEDRTGVFVEVRVSDRGPGIPSNEQALIFDPFFRGDRAVRDQIQGTGLGLNLVKKIVEAHQGTIRVDSEPSKGTQFVLRIPAAAPELQDEFAHSTS